MKLQHGKPKGLYPQQTGLLKNILGKTLPQGQEGIIFY